MLFILTPAEYEEARSSPKLAGVELQRTLAYPDGQPGFYFVRMAYVPGVDAVFAAEREARRLLVDGTAVVDGEALSVRHSRLDMGRPGELFDGEARTLVRFMEENPAVLELRFAPARHMARVDLLLTAGDWEVTARLDPDTAAAGGPAHGQDDPQRSRRHAGGGGGGHPPGRAGGRRYPPGDSPAERAGEPEDPPAGGAAPLTAGRRAPHRSAAGRAPGRALRPR